MSSSATDSATTQTRRQRVRAATIDEIKTTATRMLRERGPELRFADIAREMGMTAPALYRYFADRDELLSALMVDGFAEMSSALSAALDGAEDEDLASRIRATAIAYRSFAKEDPARFSLLFGLPDPAFGQRSDHSAGPAAGATMAVLERLVLNISAGRGGVRPLVQEVGPSWAREADSVAHNSSDGHISAELYQALLQFLTTVHGFACLEAFGHLGWISESSRDELFEAQTELLAKVMGADG